MSCSPLRVVLVALVSVFSVTDVVEARDRERPTDSAFTVGEVGQPLVVMPKAMQDAIIERGGAQAALLEATFKPGSAKVAVLLSSQRLISPIDVGDFLEPYDSVMQVFDPEFGLESAYAHQQAIYFYDRLIYDYAFQNDWRDACLDRDERCNRYPINSNEILRIVWFGVPREVRGGSRSERMRE